MSIKIEQYIWNKIVKESKSLINDEPILTDFYHKNIIQHNKLEKSLNYILSNKLKNLTLSLIKISNIIEEIYKKNPEIIINASHDIQTIIQKDPAINKFITPLLYLKGFHALQIYRISNWLWYNKRKELAIHLQHQMSMNLNVDIHPAAHIGAGVMLDHATGIVIGETAIIEDNVSILQNVTLGGTGKIKIGQRHPIIRQGALIGAGSIILGNIEIGTNSKIGAGSIVLHSIPPNTTVTGNEAKIINKNNTKNN